MTLKYWKRQNNRGKKMNNNMYRVYLKSGGNFLCGIEVIEIIKDALRNATNEQDIFQHFVDDKNTPLYGFLLSDVSAYALEVKNA